MIRVKGEPIEAFRLIACVAMQAVYVGAAALCSWLADVGLGLFQWAHDATNACLRRERACKDAFDAIDREIREKP